MCGIAGVWNQGGRLGGVDALAARARAMAAALAHRGPDDEGVWVERSVGLALAHRRLAVIDLSPAGHQPMLSADGSWVLTFNGEIYNFAALRQELADLGHSFRGSSDTEVMLAAFEAWGVLRAVERFVGMFAFAAWDRRERALWLVRDRLGKKPLYWWAGKGLVAFASELKGLMALPELPRRLDRRAVPEYLQGGFLSPPTSILEGVQALAPGSWVRLRAGGAALSGRYWQLGEVIARGKGQPFSGSLAEAAEALEEVLADAVRLRLVADVPLGAFLSGGIDSSTITALMQHASGRAVRTFSVGFRVAAYDESGHAAAVARFLGTEHTAITLTEGEALEVIPRLPEIFDEPFADSSQIPTYLVAREARRHVTVALTGDGGDELFAGYHRYPIIFTSLRRYRRLPRWLRQGVGRLAWLGTGGRHPWWLYALAPLLWARGHRLVSLQDRMRRRALLLLAPEVGNFYDRHGAACPNPDPGVWVRGGGPAAGRRLRHLTAAPLEDIEAMMALDLDRYLPDDILVKVDRASMAVALETRCPLLDHRVVEFAWRLPVRMKWDGRQGKLVLRHLLGRYVPQGLWDRPKMGFGIPVGEWLRGALREWAEELLTPRRLTELGVWRERALRRAWREHLAGAHDHRNLLWPVLMFEAWRRHWGVA